MNLMIIQPPIRHDRAFYTNLLQVIQPQICAFEIRPRQISTPHPCDAQGSIAQVRTSQVGVAKINRVQVGPA